MCAEFDSLIMSLCKFTNLQNNPDVSIVKISDSYLLLLFKNCFFSTNC